MNSRALDELFERALTALLGAHSDSNLADIAHRRMIEITERFASNEEWMRMVGVASHQSVDALLGAGATAGELRAAHAAFSAGVVRGIAALIAEADRLEFE